MDEIAETLHASLGETVVNRTGLAGHFSFELRYTAGSLSAAPTATEAGALDPGTPITIALPEQLGLKLERTTAAIEILVIDAVQQPSEN
jgi:uncharacterized protein (TIGR03435 family)